MRTIGILAISWLPWFSDSKTETTPVETPEKVEVTTVEPPPPPPPPEPPAPALFPDALPFHSSNQVVNLGMIYANSCSGCHNTVFAEWNTSSHHTGSQSTVWLEAIRSYGNGTICTSCHKPLTQQHQELTVEVVAGDVARPISQANPDWNFTLELESVGCAGCHVREGVVVGSKTSDSPHPVRNSAEIQTSEACVSCHQFQLPNESTPIYNTYQEWKNSAYANAGIQCQDCHMQNSATIGQGWISHGFDLSPKQGLTLTIQSTTKEFSRNQSIPFSFIVHNTGVGHSWPGSSPFVTKSLVVEIKDSAGKDMIKPIIHHIGNHRDSKLAGPSISVGGQHAFAQDILIANKYKAGWAELRISYVHGDTVEVLEKFTINVR